MGRGQRSIRKGKAAIAQAIRNIEHDGVLGKTTFDETGQTQIPVEFEIKEVVHGEWVPKAD